MILEWVVINFTTESKIEKETQERNEWNNQLSLLNQNRGRKSVHGIEWSEMKKKKENKKGEIKKEPGTGSEGDERTVAVKP